MNATRYWRNTVRRVKRFLLGACVVVLGAGGAWYFAGEELLALFGISAAPEQQRGEQRPPPPVQIVQARRRDIPITVASTGTLQARERITLTSEITGKARSIEFEEGQHVAQGDLLVTLDSLEPQAELAEARALLEEARQQYQRGVELRKQAVISQASFDKLEAAYQTAEAQVLVAEAQLQDYQLRAPFGGRIGLRRISPGALLTPGTEIAELSTVNPIDLRFDVPAQLLPKLNLGSKVSAHAEGFEEQVFRGRVSRIDTDVNPQTRTVTLEAELPNPDGALQPGQFMAVELVLETRENAITVPEEALLLQGQKTFLFLVQDDNTVIRRAVEAGRRMDGEVEIRQGVAAGERVVVGGLQRIRDGQKVQVQPS